METYIHAASGSDTQSSLLTPVEDGAATSSVPCPHRTFPIPTVPDLHDTILTSSRHIAPGRTWVDRYARDGPEMRKKADSRMREVRCPEGHGAVLVPEMNNGIVGILTHGMARAEFGAMLDYELTRGCVLVLEVPSITLKKC